MAQTEALMRGKTRGEARDELVKVGVKGPELDALLPHKVFQLIIVRNKSFNPTARFSVGTSQLIPSYFKKSLRIALVC